MDSLALSVELDDDDALQGLTPRQYRFAILTFSGLDHTQAYRRAGYGAGMNDNTAGKSAHTLYHLPKVQAKIRELRLKTDDRTTLVPLLTRDFVLNGVMELALGADKDSTRLAAYQTLGKTVGIDLFRETTVIEKRTRTVEDVDRELKERLAALAPMIEGQAKPAQEPDLGTRADRRRKPRDK